jgi:hypothetical protein
MTRRGKFSPTHEDVQMFLQIPRKTHKSHYVLQHADSFTGKEAVQFMKQAFNISNTEALQFGNLLLQADVIVPATYRLHTKFSDQSKFIYLFNVSSQTEEKLLITNQLSINLHHNSL